MSDKAEDEVWKVYPEIPFIEVSSLGRVRTKDRVVIRKDGRKLPIKGRILKQQLNKSGYMYVSINKNKKHITLSVHRIVAITFIPNPHGWQEVNHIDNDKTNNSVSNLEWCTREYNEACKKNFGTSQAEVSGQPVIAVNLKTSEVFLFESQSEAARQLGVYQGNIGSVIKGKQNKTGDFWFCKADENTVEKTRAKFGDNVAEKVEELMRQN